MFNTTLDIIEGQTYERYEWKENGNTTHAYICVPITLLIVRHEDIHQTHFIIWN